MTDGKNDFNTLVPIKLIFYNIYRDILSAFRDYGKFDIWEEKFNSTETIKKLLNWEV